MKISEVRENIKKNIKEITASVIVAGALLAIGTGLIMANNSGSDKNAIISGNVITDNADGKHIANVYLYNSNNMKKVVAQTETSDDGSFLIYIDDFEEDEYTVVIEKSGYLKQTINGLSIENGFESQIGTYTLLAGDVDNSGEIEIDDLVTLNNNYGKPNNKCDLNEDNIVNTLDREILKKNYGKLAQVTNLGTGYKLAYNANEGTGAPNGIIKYGDNAITVSTVVPTREGYTFAGWYENTEGEGTGYNANNTIRVENSKILYAKWTENVNVTLALNNSNKITEGTTATITGETITGISKVELIIGDKVVHSEELTDTTSYNKTIGIDSWSQLSNLEGLTFNEEYPAVARITTKNDTIVLNSAITVKNYTVGSANSLKTLATKTNEGIDFDGETIYQIADINLSSVCSSTLGNWNPIGYNSSPACEFNGTYSGNSKSVSGIYINNPSTVDKTMGLFGLVGSQGIVKKLTVSGSITQNCGSRAAGGIAGRCEGKISECTNNATVLSLNNAGGIAGYCYGGEIYNCINNGTVTKTSTGDEGEYGAGGICGNTNKYTTISKCTNTGTITSKSSLAGGIVGRVMSDSLISQSKNTGSVTSEGNPDEKEKSQGTGGIAGRLCYGTIEKCANTGDIKATTGSFAGGICGYAESTAQKIEQCYNYNCKIESYLNSAGGILARSDGIDINNCYNYFSSTNYYIKSNNANIAGGIIGVISSSISSEELSNIRTITATRISNCYNIGENISAVNDYGSIVGRAGRTDAEILNCYYLSTSSLSGVGRATATPKTENIVKKTDSLFKTSASTSSSVAYLLNGGSSGAWSQSSSINGGYPYLVNNVP